MLSEYQKAFLQAAVACQALKFGDFTLKSGRQSPYFFNAGAFADGASLTTMARSYAQLMLALKKDGVAIDMLFGPAYKGIPLVAALAVILEAEHGLSLPWAFNRKEAKDHGEGGMLVGAPVAGKRVLIVDDVLTAGTAIRQSINLLREHDAQPSAVVVAMDRMEKFDAQGSALDSLRHHEQLRADAIVTLEDLLLYIKNDKQYAPFLPKMQTYRSQYGV